MKDNLITIYEIRKAIILSYYNESVEGLNARIRFEKDYTKRDFTTLGEIYYNDIFEIAKARCITTVRNFEYLANSILTSDLIYQSYILLFNCLDVTVGEMCRFVRTLSNTKVWNLVDRNITPYEYYISRITSHPTVISSGLVDLGHRRYLISPDSPFIIANDNYITFSRSHSNINREIILDYLVNEREYLK